MTIRRITVSFLDPDGHAQSEVSGSVDRRAELIRQARAQLEKFKSEARVAGDPRAEIPYQMSIEDAPASARWSPAHS
jgi:hypothetical protein